MKRASIRMAQARKWSPARGKLDQAFLRLGQIHDAQLDALRCCIDCRLFARIILI